MFTETFDKYACEGDKITCEKDGFTVTARIQRDDDIGPPWKVHDGHGPVSDWTRRDKLPGERVLCEDRGSKMYYDIAEAVKIAKRDGWDAEPYAICKICGEGRFPDDKRHGWTTVSVDGITTTEGDHKFIPAEPRGQIAARAVEADFKAMKAWCDNEWSWCSVILCVSKNGIELEDYAACLGGIELNYPGSDNSYLTEVANELLAEAIKAGRAALEQIELPSQQQFMEAIGLLQDYVNEDECVCDEAELEGTCRFCLASALLESLTVEA